MRLLDYLTALLSLLALPFTAWWGVNQSPQSAARLEARLEARALQSLQRAGIDWASVTLDGQTAILTGGAPSGDAAHAAARSVLRSSGRGGLLFGGISQVENHAHTAEPVRPYVWTAEKMPDGKLVLSGHVPSKALRADLMQEAAAVSAGPAEDRMTVAAGAPDGNWQGIAKLAIRQLAGLEAGRAVLENTLLTVRGQSMDDALRAQITGAVSAVAAPFRGAALIRGVPLWSASLAGSELVLAGAVPSDADRQALLAIVRRGFDGEVREEMVVANTAAGGWIGGAKTGLTHLVHFRTGTLAFDPAINGFTIEGEAPASRLQFLSEDMAGTARSWRVIIAAEALPFADETPGGTCTEGMNRMLENAAVGFEPGRATFRRDDAEALDRFAGIARLCGADTPLQLDVSAGALAQARAAAMADYLERAGAARPRLAAIAYGPPEGGRVMDMQAAARSERLLEFTLGEWSGQ